MKNEILILVVAINFITHRGVAQGFVNLNFESTSLTSNGAPGTVLTATGMPGWTALIGGVSQSTVLYNNGTLGNSAVAILGSGNSLTPIIAGNFSAALTAGATGNAAISQAGLVPTNSQSFFLEAYSQGNGLPNLLVTLDGQIVSMLLISASQNASLYGGNVSSFAGQTASLTITAVSNYPAGFEFFVLDSMQFSSSPIPEPSMFSLAALGVWLLGYRRWQKLSKT